MNPSRPKQFMIIAGEPSGDSLAAELVYALRAAALAPLAFFGAGGRQMQRAGVELAFDLTQHSVVGLLEVLRKYGEFRRLFQRLLRLAEERRPDTIVCVDFHGFNGRFARAIRERIRDRQLDWRPKIVQFISPQVWASRPGRARQMARDLDLLLTIFPVEKPWYAGRVPQLRVEFVGHPIFDRYGPVVCRSHSWPSLVLLPGSRKSELDRHLPVLLKAWELIHAARPNATACMVFANETLADHAEKLTLRQGLTRGFQMFRAATKAVAQELRTGQPQVLPEPPLPLGTVRAQVGGLAEALGQATLAIASTGTVTVECAYFGVPTVTLYKTSWLTYQVGKRLVTVKSLTMPNLLAREEVFPEFVQDEATPGNVAQSSLALLDDPDRRQKIKAKLAEVIASLGGPGASRRAAEAVLALG